MMKRKKLKGFTLVEIIIALAVFAIMSLVVALIIQMASRIIKDSQYTTTKSNLHASIAEVAINEKNSTYDKIITDKSVKINGVEFQKVAVIELERTKLYDSASGRAESPDEDGFYNEAPSLKVICAE